MIQKVSSPSCLFFLFYLILLDLLNKLPFKEQCQEEVCQVGTRYLANSLGLNEATAIISDFTVLLTREFT
jgi:hypothetical protein